MYKTLLEEKTLEFLNASEENRLDSGEKIYDAPIFGFSRADDPLFEEFKNDHIVGDCFMPPRYWLSEAESVISFFLPFSEAVKSSNAVDRFEPSVEWLHGRWEGQTILNKLAQHLVNELQSQGFKAVSPGLDPRFKGFKNHNGLPMTSNWSERHVAFISGLGTFGLSKGLITEKGMAGRFGSVVTSAVFDATQRKYTEPYEYCVKCGACTVSCPAEAISIEKGKDQLVCQAFVEATKTKYKPMYGCGKCQVAVPCQSGIPK